MCLRTDDPDGFLFKGDRLDEVCDGPDETKELSLSTRFRKRYDQATGEKCWPKLFNSLRVSAIIVMVNIKNRPAQCRAMVREHASDLKSARTPDHA